MNEFENKNEELEKLKNENEDREKNIKGRNDLFFF
jgi:hypothetical protein